MQNKVIWTLSILTIFFLIVATQFREKKRQVVKHQLMVEKKESKKLFQTILPLAILPLENDHQQPELKATRAPVLYLNAQNFEENFLRCYSSDCEIEGSPWQLYQIFKKNNRQENTDRLIDYMLLKVNNSAYKDKYKDSLEHIIKDFYPPYIASFRLISLFKETDDFPALLKSSLAHDKEKPNSINIKIDIADAYYELGQKKEALKYYETAIQLIESGNNYFYQDTLILINERINELKENN